MLQFLRDFTKALDLAIGFSVVAILVGFIFLFVVAPFMLVRTYILEGDLVRAALLALLVGGYTIAAIRAAVKRELGPDALFAGLGALAVVSWLAFRFLH